MAITIPGLRIDGSAADTGVQPLTTPQGQLSEQAGTIGVIGEVQLRKDKRDAAAYNMTADANLQLYGAEALQDSINQVEKPEDITTTFVEKYNQRYQELRQNAPNNFAREQLDQRFQQLSTSYTKSAIVTQANEIQAYRLGQLEGLYSDISGRVASGKLTYDQGKAVLSSATDGAAEFTSPSKLQQIRRSAKQDLATTAFYSKTDRERYAITRSATANHPGGFNKSMELVEQNEGGYVESDGASGQPALFGINRGAHKAAYERVLKITREQGDEAGKKAARDFYKEEFWDKYNIGQLPKNVQAIVYDGAINHGSTFRNKLIDAAQNGAEPAELIAMREEEYKRLAQNPEYAPSLTGWMNRMDNVEAAVLGSTGSEFDDMPVDQKIKAYQQAQNYEMKLEGLRKSDPGAWGKELGLSPEEIALSQRDPFFASVVAKDDAKEMVVRLGQLQNVDEVMTAAQEIKQKYGSYSENAIRDLANNGLSPEVESAINLSLRNPAGYAGQINTFIGANNTGSSELNKLMKDMGTTEADLRAKFTSKFDDEIMKPMLAEGRSPSEIGMLKDAYINASKQYMVSRQTDSYSDAIDYVMKPLLEQYNTVDVLGQNVRIPMESKSGAPYNRETIEERANIAVQDMVFEAQKQYAMTGQEFNNNYQLSLNAQENGILMKSLLGDPIFRADGTRYEVLFDDLLSPKVFKSQIDSVRDKLNALPYEERERMRKQMFDLGDKPFDPHNRSGR